MIAKPHTLKERRALQFGARLIRDFGYGYTVHVPSRQLSEELSERGASVSFITIISYWEALERMGYVSRQMNARINGVTYYLNRYAFKKLLKDDVNL